MPPQAFSQAWQCFFSLWPMIILPERGTVNTGFHVFVTVERHYFAQKFFQGGRSPKPVCYLKMYKFQKDKKRRRD
jgi:hypothetical protein